MIWISRTRQVFASLLKENSLYISVPMLLCFKISKFIKTQEDGVEIFFSIFFPSLCVSKLCLKMRLKMLLFQALFQPLDYSRQDNNFDNSSTVRVLYSNFKKLMYQKLMTAEALWLRCRQYNLWQCHYTANFISFNTY